MELMESLNGRSAQVRASLCMAFVFICFGIPLWWKTTEVYRADLPYSEIRQLAEDSSLFMAAKVKLVTSSAKILKRCNEIFSNNNFDVELSSTRLKLTFDVISQPISNEKIQNYADKEIFSSTVTDVLLILTSDKPDFKIAVTQVRSILVNIPSSYTDEQLEQAIKETIDVLQNDVMNLQSIDDVVSKAFAVKLDFPKERELHIKKTVQPDKGYDLLFTLICPEPHKLQVTWDIYNTTRMYLEPLLTKLGNYSKFIVESQILHYSGMPVKPKKAKDGAGYVLEFQRLPHVVNPIESRLGAEMSSNPTLNFVVYLTEDRYNPLRIKRQDGKISTTNTFLVPRWGAIMIKNIEKNSSSSPRKLKLEGKEFIGVFIAQLRSLLGVEVKERLSVEFQPPGPSALTDFEFDYLIRTRAAQNIATSIHTIHSLAKLLEKIQNIVINDEIAEQVYIAVNQIKLAKSALENSRLNDALIFSNNAFEASETAFFDPTLLELLYFPEDQKFAIYIPLFLPISLPLISSLVNAIKIRKSQKSKSKVE